ncbi:MAG TPA: protein-export chaperone SecB [Paracoccaceae bacterium]|nr:protein-export chaperone SecB [Paracoccaceae bacterium]
MSDETTNSGGAPGSDGGAAAAARPAPNLRILAHFVRDLSFENVAALQGSPTQGTPEINVSVNLDGGAIAENRYQVGMKVNATAKVEDTTRFIVELDYVGVFEITNVPKEHLHPFLFIECPRQILPYARRVISDVTRDGGYPPLMLDNIDFAALYRQKLEEMRAKQAAAPAN